MAEVLWVRRGPGLGVYEAGGTSSAHLQACLWFTDETAAPAWTRAENCQVRGTDTWHLRIPLAPGETSCGMPSLSPGSFLLQGWFC